MEGFGPDRNRTCSLLRGVSHVRKGVPMNQTERLRNYLEIYGEISPMTAWNELGIYRLSARIHDLKGAGMNIGSETKTVLNRWGEKCRVANYRLVR